MDRGPDRAEYDDLIQRHGRRLFVLAYHLTGEATRAEELSVECLVRSLLASDFPSTDSEAGVFLYRGLITLCRERADLPGGATTLRAAGAPGALAALWQALSRLDPVSRAVLVLRVAEGLEYETIGKVLDMAPDVVYARLLQARGGLREGERALEASLFETMNLYLDGRLSGDQRGAFERRLRTDAELRERVEFHRGLTLDLHEEAPALPRDFTGRLLERLDRAQETLLLVDEAARTAGWEPAAQPGRPGPPPSEVRRLSLWAAGLVGALVLLVVGAALGHWVAGRRPAPASVSGRSQTPANPSTTPDEATLEKLRSLGYLAPGKGRPKEKSGKEGRAQTRLPKPVATPTTGKTRPATGPAPGAKRPALPEPVAGKSPGRTAVDEAVAPAGSPSSESPSASPSPSANSTPAATSVLLETPTPAPSPAEAAPREATVVWRVIPFTKALDPGRDRQVIRTSQEWAALFDGTGAPPPEVAFDKEMAVLLRDDPAADPPVHLVVVGVRKTSEALLIDCRREERTPDAGSGAAVAASQAVVVPISDLPVWAAVR